MIQSMTGYGAAQHDGEGGSYALEIRSLNNRYLKLTVKLPDHLQFVESDIDRQLRRRLNRGSVAYTLRFRGAGESGTRPLNESALQGYVDQLAKVRVPEGFGSTLDLAVLATLPGVCESPEIDEQMREERRGIISKLTDAALDDLIAMRQTEGKTLHAEFMTCCQSFRTYLDEIGQRAPNVVDEYHERLRTRVDTLMQSGGFELQAEGLMREVAIYAERCDINEELSRIRSHLEQFVQLCDSGEKVGRTLDFLSQELLREANTIASKSNDAQIARNVVEVKGLIDRLKEQVQNVE